MILIGHRGAAGMKPENTIVGIETSVKERMDMIEFDLYATKDKRLAVLHDPNLKRIAGINDKVADMTLEQVQTTVTLSGEPIPSFHEALEACGDIPALLDCKDDGWAEILAHELLTFKGPTPAVTAIDQRELVYFSELMPHVETYISELTKPFNAIHSAKTLRLSGVSLNFWVLNPLSYYYARRNHLHILVFTVNKAWLARFIHFFYPKVGIISNHPDLMNKTFKRTTKKR